MMSPGRDTSASEEDCTLRKGVLWYCRDTLLSRWNWKERYFILTDDYLSCFKKAKGQYSDMGAFLFKLPLASLTGVEWQRLRGQAAVAVSDPREGRLLFRAPQDVLDQWYKVLKRAAECSRERRRFLRLSSSNLSTLGLGPVGAPGAPGAPSRAPLSDSSPAIDRLCERVEREVWGGGAGGSAGRLMRRQKSELDAGVVLRRQMHYASQKRLNRHSSHSPSTTPSKSSVSSSEGAAMQLRGGPGGAGGSRVCGLDGSTDQRISSVRRRSRGHLSHLEQGRPQSMIYDGPSHPVEVVLRTKERSNQLRHEQRVQHRRSCDVTLLNRRTAYLAQYEH
ncbi:hypothetical protein FJT64_017591 [Amphibalanus amphitrite]|uniref:PH domain-containing protein n=1 Tax=Amphibalanus amphitrite TaxID=1232801 RepID=A0A6A4WVZ8_AMPAM|nr:hypothetical protein FJT64_017591 [Amphibalanus amphitrite]